MPFTLRSRWPRRQSSTADDGFVFVTRDADQAAAARAEGLQLA